MKFFSGFCFDGELKLFDEYLEYNDFCVAGFSYGAIKAFEYTSTCRARIDKLQLFSPAFFQNRDDKFKRLQTISFSKNRQGYIKNFLSQVKYPSSVELDRYFHEGKLSELKELLFYEWSGEKLDELRQKGIDIEVYLGEKDRIIDSQEALEFFTQYATVYYKKGVGHLLS
jgi:alpha-beta hydrolase superfamily lysophospholipase